MIENKEIYNKLEEYLASAEEYFCRMDEFRNRGLYRDDDLLTSLCSHLHLEGIKLSDEINKICLKENVAWSENEWQDIENELMKAYRLRWVPFQFFPADIGFDELHEGVHVFQDRIRGLEELYFHSEPIGKKFDLELELTNGDGTVWVDYKISVRRVYAGQDRWKGYKTFEGTGRFPGYGGEVGINIKETDYKLHSCAYQKVYVQSSDPIWSNRKKEPEIRYCRDLLESVKTDTE